MHGLEVLETVVRNVVRFPQEEKFRRLRTSNEKLAPLLGLSGARGARMSGLCIEVLRGVSR